MQVRLQDVLEHAQLRHFLRLERLRIVEHLAVAVAEDVGRVPALEAEVARLEAGREDGLHQRLAGLEVLAADRQLLLLGQLLDRREVDRQVGRAVGERHARAQAARRRRSPTGRCCRRCCAGPPRTWPASSARRTARDRPRSSRTRPRRSDRRRSCFLKRSMSAMSCSARSIFDLPCLDVGAVQLLDVRRLEHARHRADALEERPHLVEVLVREHAGVLRRLVGVVLEDVPAAEHQIVERRRAARSR